MLIDRSTSNILPAPAKGKAVQAIHVYRDEQSLNIDLRLQDGLALELSFSIAYQFTAQLVHWENGNSRVVETAS